MPSPRFPSPGPCCGPQRHAPRSVSGGAGPDLRRRGTVSRRAPRLPSKCETIHRSPASPRRLQPHMGDSELHATTKGWDCGLCVDIPPSARAFPNPPALSLSPRPWPRNPERLHVTFSPFLSSSPVSYLHPLRVILRGDSDRHAAWAALVHDLWTNGSDLWLTGFWFYTLADLAKLLEGSPDEGDRLRPVTLGAFACEDDIAIIKQMEQQRHDFFEQFQQNLWVAPPFPFHTRLLTRPLSGIAIRLAPLSGSSPTTASPSTSLRRLSLQVPVAAPCCPPRSD